MRRNIYATIGIDATGFSKESTLKCLANVGYNPSTNEAIDSTIIIFGREDDIISEDINISTVYTIPT
jgi:FAD synthase